ncbi:MAG: zinc ribbon domain-containing protein [Proteobacteria bacterium]|nr:zinc ribbon domain-containing protein [Pseudomonadota bacterium]
MPIYEYECTECGRVDEIVQKVSDKPLTQCRHCSGGLRKLISQSAFHLKGGGWYADNYGNKSSTGSTVSKPAAASTTDTSSVKKSDS